MTFAALEQWHQGNDLVIDSTQDIFLLLLVAALATLMRNSLMVLIMNQNVSF